MTVRTALPRSARVACGLLLAAAFAGAQATGRPGGYLGGDLPPLAELLAPPPAAGSAEARADLEAVLALQRSRTPAESAEAVADVEISPFRFADAIGPGFDPARTPRVAALLDGTADDLRGGTRAAKARWERPRPAEASDAVAPLVEAHGASYPSGHATYAYVAAIVLARMLPERSEAIFARAGRYARNRVVAGVHYPSDVDAGRIAGTVLADRLFRQPAFRRDFEAAREELRAALGLPDAATSAPSATAH
ncbi:acid phosphatase [Coralloluteibacterium thermophilus]|uniref:Acid phosphatase n=1 Tax=Coralloluteibacterium thermophilum TaxID=2707049 RepID=A0ABV9NLS1_9GAMM